MRSILDQFRQEIEGALGGRSIAGEALRAGLPRDAIRRVLKGHDPSLTRAAEICEALGLELHIGPRRNLDSARVPRDALSPIDALAPPEPAAAERANGPADLARTIQRSAAELVRAALGLGRNPIPPDLWPVLAAHHGEALPPGNEDVPAAGQPVEVIEFAAAAGDGGGEAVYGERKGLVWFRRSWLERRGLDAGDCMVIGVGGESMEPTLPDGCSILVDRASTEWKPPSLLVVRTADGLVVKRAAEADDGTLVMVSDNPYWPDAPLPEDAEIVGRVRWMAHSI